MDVNRDDGAMDEHAQKLLQQDLVSDTDSVWSDSWTESDTDVAECDSDEPALYTRTSRSPTRQGRYNTRAKSCPNLDRKFNLSFATIVPVCDIIFYCSLH